MKNRALLLPLACCLIALAALPAAPACAEATQSIAYLCKTEGPNRAIDDAAMTHIASLGFTVHAMGEATSPDEVKDDLVILSSTVSGKNVSPAWRQSGKPLLTWENDSLDDLAMTGKRHDTDFGEAEKERYLWLVNAPHPISGGLKAGLVNVYTRQSP